MSTGDPRGCPTCVAMIQQDIAQAERPPEADIAAAVDLLTEAQRKLRARLGADRTSRDHWTLSWLVTRIRELRGMRDDLVAETRRGGR